jgi:hypothetical protein
VTETWPELLPSQMALAEAFAVIAEGCVTVMVRTNLQLLASVIETV